MNEIEIFLIENFTCIVIISSVIFLFIIIVESILIKKEAKEKNKFVCNVLNCAIYDSKHRINEYEVARKIN